MAQAERVLLTGGNGVIGSAVLLALCEAGYIINAVVRRQDAVDKTSAHPSINKHLDKIQWTIVPDFTKPDAFADAVKGCHHIVHVASPLPFTSRAYDLRTAALQVTQSILNAAESAPLVKRLVVTGSEAGLTEYSEWVPEGPPYQPSGAPPPRSGATYLPTPPDRPADDSAPFRRYVDSKLASGNLVRDYATAHPDSHFQIVLLCPSWVLGPGLLIRNKTEALSTANLVLAWVMMNTAPFYHPMLGIPTDVPTPVRSGSVWIDDVVLAHVRALSVPLPDGEKSHTWLLASQSPSGGKISDAGEILRRRRPDIAEKLSFPGRVQDMPTNVDGTSAERELLGKKYVPFEEQIIRAVEWMVSLPDAEPASA